MCEVMIFVYDISTVVLVDSYIRAIKKYDIQELGVLHFKLPGVI